VTANSVLIARAPTCPLFATPLTIGPAYKFTSIPVRMYVLDVFQTVIYYSGISMVLCKRYYAKFEV